MALMSRDIWRGRGMIGEGIGWAKGSVRLGMPCHRRWPSVHQPRAASDVKTHQLVDVRAAGMGGRRGSRRAGGRERGGWGNPMTRSLRLPQTHPAPPPRAPRVPQRHKVIRKATNCEAACAAGGAAPARRLRGIARAPSNTCVHVSRTTHNTALRGRPRRRASRAHPQARRRSSLAALPRLAGARPPAMGRAWPMPPMPQRGRALEQGVQTPPFTAAPPRGGHAPTPAADPRGTRT